MIAWFVLILCFAVVLTLGVNRLLARLGIRRADDPESDAARGDLAAMASQLERWAVARKNRQR